MSETTNVPETLRLVRLSPDYPLGFRSPGISDLPMTEPESDAWVFYAFDGEDAPAYVTLAVPEHDDPRSAGMWLIGGTFPGHRGWRVEARYVTNVDTPEATPTTPDTSEADALRERIANLEESARRQAREFEAWKARATEIAHQYAEDNSLCGEFDRCMEDIGLEPRTRDYAVHFTLYVSARDEDDAIDRAREDFAELEDSGWAERQY